MSTRMRAVLTNQNGVYYGGTAYGLIESAYADMLSRGTVAAKPNPAHPRYRRCKVMIKSLRGYGLRLFREPRNTPTRKSLFGQLLFTKFGYWPKSKKQKDHEVARQLQRTRVAFSPPVITALGGNTGRVFSATGIPSVTETSRIPTSLQQDLERQRTQGAIDIQNEARNNMSLSQAYREWDRRRATVQTPRNLEPVDLASWGSIPISGAEAPEEQ